MKKKKLTPEEMEKLGETSRKGQEARDLVSNLFLQQTLEEVLGAYNQIINELGPAETEKFSHYASKKDAIRDVRITLQALDKKGQDADLLLAGKAPKKRGLL